MVILATVPARPSRLMRLCRLGVAIAAVAIVWMVVLPWLANRPPLARHIQWLEQQGIDAGAMYYTDLEAMEPILQRLERPGTTAAKVLPHH